MTTGMPDVALEAEGGTGPGALAAGAPITARSPLELFWRRLRSDRVALAALVVIGLLALAAILATPIRELVGAPPPNAQDHHALNSFGNPTGPSSKHIWGVDNVGEDIFSRVLYGARVSLLVALAATVISLTIGTAVGLLAGFYRGVTDTLLSRLMDVVLSFPVLLLGLGIGAACLKGCVGGLLMPGLSTVIAIIALIQWPYFGRLVRGQVLSLREQEFVEASRSLGASGPRIMFGEILPNLVAPTLVYATLVIPQNILLEAALSFLGVGVRPPNPSWGAMLAKATDYFSIAWWFMLFPGLALLVTVLAFNIVGDGLQDALNPRTGR